MSEHTPTVERARDMYSWAYAWRTDDDIEGGDSDLSQMRVTLRAEFDRMLAAHDQEVRAAALEEAEKAVEELAEAIRLTVEYVGIEVLPPLEGWSWFDALRRHRPAMASHFAVPGDSCPEGGRQ